ncbi:MAG: 50S ribosomal protein L25 [bacterium]
METIKLTVREREATGDGPAGRMRAVGQIPGVTYSKGQPGTAISVDLVDLRAALAHGHNVVLELEFEGAAKTGKGKSTKAAKAKQPARYAVVKAMQFHPTRRQVLHIDLHEVDLAVEIEAPVPVELLGVPVGVEDGGVLDWEHREVIVRALPGDIPSVLQLDVSELLIGQNVTVSALSAPVGVVIVDEPDVMVASVLAPRLEVEEPEEEVGEELLEPEVIGEAESEEPAPEE